MGILWWGVSICFGTKVLNDYVYYQQVMTILENKKGKEFWSKKLRSVFREWGKIEIFALFRRVLL